MIRTRMMLGMALVFASGGAVVAAPMLPGGGTLSGTIAILSDGSIVDTDDYQISAAGVTIAPGAVEYLAVGGGGGGGTSTSFSTAGSGGGGAGGMVEGTLGISQASYDVQVGDGGATGSPGNNPGANGGNSLLGPVTALGGGGGAGGNMNGRDGGSGGGGRGNSTSGGAAQQPASTSGGLGNPGGTGGGAQGAGGGGGAGAAGGNTSNNDGGAGGAGWASSITGSELHYAGGGGGGGRIDGTPGSGGIGGGGDGANDNIAATPGAANTGGGGGGGNNDRVGATGGSGVVYLRYFGDGPVSTSGDAVSQLTDDDEGYTLHAFTTTGSSAFELNAGVSLPQQVRLAGTLSGDGTLTKTGSGILTLSTSGNTYTGGTIINAGTLRINNDGSLGAVPGAFTADNIVLDGGILKNDGPSITLDENRGITLGPNHGTIEVRSSTEFVVPGIISGPGDLAKIDGGTLVLGGANTYEGSTNIRLGTVRLGHNSALGATAAGTTILAGGTLDLNGRNIQGEAITVAGTITNTGGEQQNALRNVTLSGDATFTGSGRWDIRGGGGVLNLNDHTLTKTGGNKMAVVDSNINGLGSVVVNDGTFALTRSRWSEGDLTLNSGATLDFENNSGTNHTYEMDMLLNGGTVRARGGPTTVSGPVTLGGTITFQVDNDSLTANGDMSGSGGVNKTNGGTLVLTGTNTFTGTNTLRGGTLAVAGTSGLGTGLLDFRAGGGQTITFRSADAGTLTLDNALNMASNVVLGSADTGNLVFNGSLNGGGGPKTFTVNNAMTTFNGVLIGSNNPFTKNGPGTLVFNGNNTYTKPTIVDAGTLLVNGSHTNAGAYTVNSGATLGGTGSIGGPTTIHDGAFLAPGESIGMLSFTDDLTWQPGSTLLWEFVNNDEAGEDYDSITGSSLVLPENESNKINLSILGLEGYRVEAGDSFTLFEGDVYQGSTLLDLGADVTDLFHITDNIGWWGTWEVSTGSLILTAVPEPGTWLLLLSALAGGLLVRRRRR